MTNLGPNVALHFSAFSPQYKLQSIPATSLESILKSREIAMSRGLSYVYCGNVHHLESVSTWCSHCGHLLIERNAYTLGEINLDEHANGKQCGQKCPGVFS